MAVAASQVECVSTQDAVSDFPRRFQPQPALPQSGELAAYHPHY